MRNGTTFRFVDATPPEVLDMATRAANGQDVALSGGPDTIRQFIDARLIDEMHLAIAPVLLGEGERLFRHLPAGTADYSCSELTCSAGIAHAHLTRTAPGTGLDRPERPQSYPARTSPSIPGARLLEQHAAHAPFRA